jgi:hypothetical protein
MKMVTFIEYFRYVASEYSDYNCVRAVNFRLNICNMFQRRKILSGISNLQALGHTLGEVMSE